MPKTINPVSGVAWKVSVARSMPVFLRALPELVPEGSMLYIESGGRPPEATLPLLEELSIHDDVKVPGGTLLPRPTIYTLPITLQNMERLATVEEEHPTPVGSLHIHVYNDGEMLLSSYDAFLDPFTVSTIIPENRIRAFSEALGSSLEKTA